MSTIMASHAGLTLVLLVALTGVALSLSSNANTRTQTQPSDRAMNQQTVSIVETMSSNPISLPSFQASTVCYTKSDEPSLLSKLNRLARVFLLAGHVFCSYKIVQFKEKLLERDWDCPWKRSIPRFRNFGTMHMKQMHGASSEIWSSCKDFELRSDSTFPREQTSCLDSTYPHYQVFKMVCRASPLKMS